jgi:bifunctional DNA-binding transcriptional regulator/antitoxin component of YhaV-PrlF toxin-antitoxin module
MDNILGGLLFINETDVWKTFGVFLYEEKAGGKNNLKAIMAASNVKEHIPVKIREKNGEKYSDTLQVTNDARDVTLYFAQYSDSKSGWLEKYKSFISFLKHGEKGWLNIRFPELEDLTLKVFYHDSSEFKPLTYLYKEGRQVGCFKVKFREPNPEI